MYCSFTETLFGYRQPVPSYASWILLMQVTCSLLLEKWYESVIPSDSASDSASESFTVMVTGMEKSPTPIVVTAHI